MSSCYMGVQYAAGPRSNSTAIFAMNIQLNVRLLCPGRPLLKSRDRSPPV